MGGVSKPFLDTLHIENGKVGVSGVSVVLDLDIYRETLMCSFWHPAAFPGLFIASLELSGDLPRSIKPPAIGRISLARPRYNKWA